MNIECTLSSKVKILIAVADVDSIVKNGAAIDDHARHNTTSIYTAPTIFPMLPEKLSTNLTSSNFNEDRLSIVVEIVIGGDGSLQDSDIYRALVRNRAKLAYNSVAVWLEGKGIVPEAIATVNRYQKLIAQLTVPEPPSPACRYPARGARTIDSNALKEHRGFPATRIAAP